MASRYTSEILVVITATDWDTTPTDEVLYAALYGGIYTDAANPSGPKIHYDGRVKSDVILDKKIGTVFWQEESEIDFGYIDIAIEDQPADWINFAQVVTLADLDVYRVDGVDGSLELMATARTSDIGFADERTIRFRLESKLTGGFDKPINEHFYDSSYPQLEGKPYPIVWGVPSKIRQVFPAILVDPTSLLYHVTDMDITGTPGANMHPYDRGVALTTHGTGNEFLMFENGFELLQNPDGKITFGATTTNDMQDDPDEPAGTALSGLQPIVRIGLTRAGLWASADDTELTALSSVVSGGGLYPLFHTLEVVSAKDFMNQIFDGFGGWYYVDELSQIRFGQLDEPSDLVDSLSPAFTDANVIGEIEVEDDKAPGLTSRVNYAPNPGYYEQDELAGSVSNADRADLTTPHRTVETTEPIITYYEKAQSREPIMFSNCEFFFLSAWRARDNAKGVLDSWWNTLYPQRRRFYTFQVLINDPLFDDISLPELGTACTLQSDTFDLLTTPVALIIRRVRFNFASGLLTIQGWG